MSEREVYPFKIEVKTKNGEVRKITVSVPHEKLGRFIEALTKKGKLVRAETIEKNKEPEQASESSGAS